MTRLFKMLCGVALLVSAVEGGLLVWDARTTDAQEQLVRQLTALPDVKQSEAQQSQLASTIGSQLNRLPHIQGWKADTPLPPPLGRCDGDPGLLGGGKAAAVGVSSTYVAPAIPPDRRHDALLLITGPLAAAGYTSVDMVIGPGNETLLIPGPGGAQVNLSFGKHTELSLATGCRLRPGVKLGDVTGPAAVVGTPAPSLPADGMPAPTPGPTTAAGQHVKSVPTPGTGSDSGGGSGDGPGTNPRSNDDSTSDTGSGSGDSGDGSHDSPDPGDGSGTTNGSDSGDSGNSGSSGGSDGGSDYGGNTVPTEPEAPPVTLPTAVKTTVGLP